jgi:hypothetical protein
MRTGVARLTGVFMIVAALAGLAVPVVADSRHSGTVVSVDAKAGRVIVEEMLQGTTTRKLTVPVGSDTRLVLSERLPDADVKTFTPATRCSWSSARRVVPPAP